MVDAVKRAALSQLLLETFVTSAPGEKLEEKLANLSLPSDYAECQLFFVLPSIGGCCKRASCSYIVPAPSTDEVAWWDKPGS